MGGGGWGSGIGLTPIPRVVSQVTALRACTVLGVVGTLGVLCAPGQLTFLGYGWLADGYGARAGYGVLLPCYL